MYYFVSNSKVTNPVSGNPPMNITYNDSLLCEYAKPDIIRFFERRLFFTLIEIITDPIGSKQAVQEITVTIEKPFLLLPGVPQHVSS